MQNFDVISQFRVEITSLKISRRYRIVIGIHPCDGEKKSYWVETYLPNSRIWIKEFKYARWSTMDELFKSNEFKCIMFAKL